MKHPWETPAQSCAQIDRADHKTVRRKSVECVCSSRIRACRLGLCPDIDRDLSASYAITFHVCYYTRDAAVTGSKLDNADISHCIVHPCLGRRLPFQKEIVSRDTSDCGNQTYMGRYEPNREKACCVCHASNESKHYNRGSDYWIVGAIEHAALNCRGNVGNQWVCS